MRIISKFKDYYDNNGYIYGVDRSIVYVRKVVRVSDVEGCGKNFYNLSVPSNFSKRYSLTSGSLWFCGKEYPLNIVEDTMSEKSIVDYIDNDPRLFNYKSINYYSVCYMEQKALDAILGKLVNFTPRQSWLGRSDRACDFMRTNDDINVKYNSPCVFISKFGVIINPPLLELGFQKIMEPQQAFQEIQMYLMGVLINASMKEPLPLNEKDQVRRHGMDRWSFRKKGKKSK